MVDKMQKHQQNQSGKHINDQQSDGSGGSTEATLANRQGDYKTSEE